MGFILQAEEAQKLILDNPNNKDVLFPYLIGEDINSRPDQSSSRWIINFFDWSLSAEHDDKHNPQGPPYVSDYSGCLAIVEDKVKPERTRVNSKGEFILRKPLPQKWWIYGEKRPALYSALKSMSKTLVIPRVSKYLNVCFTSSSQVIGDSVSVIALETLASFVILQSTVHQLWTVTFQSSLETRGRYTPSDCFETFPFPTPDPSDLSTQFPALDTIGETYYTHRQAVMRDRQEGLTKTYNRFHDPNEKADDIQKLRELHIEMDWEVANAYGWQDLDLGHDFHTTKQGIRFTISETARREVLDRLLELNHQRYAEEVAQGLHDKKKAKGKGQKAKGKKAKVIEPETVQQGELF